MENIKINLNCLKPEQTRRLENCAGSAIEDERKKKIAKDFEGVLLNKIMDEMQNSVPESGLLEDETSKQTRSLFWMYLSQDVASKGGFGLWKQIYAQINEMPGQCGLSKNMDANL